MGIIHTKDVRKGLQFEHILGWCLVEDTLLTVGKKGRHVTPFWEGPPYLTLAYSSGAGEAVSLVFQRATVWGGREEGTGPPHFHHVLGGSQIFCPLLRTSSFGLK